MKFRPDLPRELRKEFEETSKAVFATALFDVAWKDTGRDGDGCSIPDAIEIFKQYVASAKAQVSNYNRRDNP